MSINYSFSNPYMAMPFACLSAPIAAPMFMPNLMFNFGFPSPMFGGFGGFNFGFRSSGSKSSGGNQSLLGKLVSTAKSWIGKINSDAAGNKQFSNGRREAWCADFVTYNLKKAGINWLGSSSVSGLKEQGTSKGKYLSIDGKSSSNRASYIAQNVKPGYVMIQKNNISHTGIVTKVYDDGSYDTVEGNTSNKVAARHYKASDHRTSGFIAVA